MSELRQRTHSEQPSNTGSRKIESDDDDLEELPGLNLTGRDVGQGSGTAPEALDSVTKNMTSRWRNWTVRVTIGFLMIFGFIYLLYLGPLALTILVLVIQFKCFSEIINIGYVVYRSQNLPWFRTLSWYFLLTSNYFLYGETMIDQFGILLQKTDFLRPLATYHRFISFSLYMCGFVAFVFSLVRKHYIRQFTLFGYTHVTLLVLVAGSHFIIRTIFEGVFWFFMSTSLIICNDIWAYFCGFFFGKTPLIKLSPKKTWEGFIGGALATVIYSLIVTCVLIQYDSLTCPIDYNLRKQEFMLEGCLKNPVFVLTEFNLPRSIQNVLQLFGSHQKTIFLYPILFHSISLAVFASVIGPFGGFFASGFKRAFRIKDFGDIFPGHGGFMDRFDCQLLMGMFVHIYFSTFIMMPNPQKLLTQVFALLSDEQVDFYHKLRQGLIERGLIFDGTA